MNSIIISFLFIVSGVLIGSGLILQVKFILIEAINGKSKKRFLGLFTKFFGFVILGYIIVSRQFENLSLNLVLFLASFVSCFLFYVLARRYLLR